MKPLRVLILVLIILIFNGPSIWAIEFFYNFVAGDKYRIISTVHQDIYVDRRLSFQAEIINRVTVEITDAASERGRLLLVFQSAEKTVPVGGENTAAPFQWSKDYQTEYEQDRLGYMTVGAQYFMPFTRNIPVFPGRVLHPGDTWSADGLEVHDFRDNFGISEPYRIPFTANYTYLGERVWKGEAYPAFSVSYRIFLEPAPAQGRVFPLRIQAASDQTVYWDVDRGQAIAYEGYFRTIFDLSDGQTWEYRGRVEAEVIEAPPMDREEMAKDIAEEIAEIPDVSVRISDEGIVITLENIQFAPDSAVLTQSEMAKLDIIAGVLMNYPGRDILVGGHTALAGTPAGRLQLSLERAASVAEYLISKNVRSADRVVIRGYGADQPIADNRTSDGMARNRRVEITILEN
jgi:outer membrane protein OmpA-like peptidoglycan-associated protein